MELTAEMRWTTRRVVRVALLASVITATYAEPLHAEQPFPIQKPGEIQQPKGPWQTPGTFQVPKGIQAIHQESARCQQRLTVGADALFEFDQSELNPEAEKTLRVLGPMIQQLGTHPAVIEGHTDAIGTAEYNQRLSERRAGTVKGWLVGHDYLPAATPTTGYGKSRPLVPNTNPDGSDNPQGRQRNRRVEVVIDTCR